jgi:hypothetical protein
MKRILAALLVAGGLAVAVASLAAMVGCGGTTKGAAIGAGVGAITGDIGKGMAAGAAVGTAVDIIT